MNRPVIHRLLLWLCRKAGLETHNQTLKVMLLLTDEQQATLKIEPKTDAGNPAKVDGIPEWESSAPEIVSVSPSTDGMSAIVRAEGPLGAAQITAQADADLGEGFEPITGVLDIEVQAAQAVSLLVVAGAPEPKTES